MRLIIVSNRLPFVASEENGGLVFKPSAGGLVSGLSAYLDGLNESSLTRIDHLWIGWSGVSMNEITEKRLKREALAKFRAYPVCLDEETMDKFYHGFCNKTVWPLFHYFSSYAHYDEAYWTHYQTVNQKFCDTVLEILQPDDLVWIHDYHLMLLPKLLKKKMPHTPIGFFLHIPFPSYELIRAMPTHWRTEILEGLLGADLIGFHVSDYLEHFGRSVSRFLGYPQRRGSIIANHHRTRIQVFPMGIDYARFHNAALNLQPDSAEFTKGLGTGKVILSIDRLDYAKGIVNRLLGFEQFLLENPAWHKQVVFCLIVVPSRIGVEDYQATKKHIDELVGRINGKFGGIDWTPISYQYTFLPFQPLVALYKNADIALVTPLRDGMNLVAKEYIATRTDQTGVLILSELAGAVEELKEAVIINPNNVPAIGRAVKQALEMPRQEQIRRNRAMQKRLQRYTVVDWANDFIQTLVKVKPRRGN